MDEVSLVREKYTACNLHNKLCNSVPSCLRIYSSPSSSALFSNTFSANNWPRTTSALSLCFSCSFFLPGGLAAHVLASGITGLVLNSRVVPPRSLQLLCWLNPIKGPETTHPARCCFLWWVWGEGQQGVVSNKKENTWAEDDVFLCCLVDTVQIMKERLMFPMWVFALNSGYCAPLWCWP